MIRDLLMMPYSSTEHVFETCDDFQENGTGYVSRIYLLVLDITKSGRIHKKARLVEYVYNKLCFQYWDARGCPS